MIAKLDTAVLWAWPETTAVPVEALVILKPWKHLVTYFWGNLKH